MKNYFSFILRPQYPTEPRASEPAVLSQQDTELVLVKQGASKRRIGLYLARWLGWASFIPITVHGELCDGTSLSRGGGSMLNSMQDCICRTSYLHTSSYHCEASIAGPNYYTCAATTTNAPITDDLCHQILERPTDCVLDPKTEYKFKNETESNDFYSCTTNNLGVFTGAVTTGLILCSDGTTIDLPGNCTASDTTAPIVSETTAVSTPTNNTTPWYIFNSNESGFITYRGDCSARTLTATPGNNRVQFNSLTEGAHSNCTIRVTDSAGNASIALAVTSFTIDTTAPTLGEVTVVPTPGNNTTPSYTFSSSEAGTISYGGDCSSATTTATAGNNTVTFNTLAEGAHSNCTITVTDEAENASSALAITSFTIDTTAPVVTINTLTTNDTTPELTGTVDDTTATISVNVDSADYVATNNGNGTWTLVNDTIAELAVDTYEVVVTATDTAGNAGTDATNNELVIEASYNINANKDFNGDGKADILWHNTDIGLSSIWFMDGITRVSYTPFQGITNFAWDICGTGDFNQDGQTDILWRNSSDGRNSIWYMNGATYVSHALSPAMSNLDWDIAGVADFDLDGKPDILWRNYATGANSIWYMDNTTRLSYSSIQSIANVAWHVGAINDFDGDGYVDIVWRNYSTGANSIWYMQNNTYLSYNVIDSITNLDWYMVGSGDYNDDGKADLLWRNYTTGANSIWFMDNATRLSYSVIEPITNTAWAIRGEGKNDVTTPAP